MDTITVTQLYEQLTMRWMFIFWVGQVAVTVSLFMLFLKK